MHESEFRFIIFNSTKARNNQALGINYYFGKIIWIESEMHIYHYKVKFHKK